MIIDLHKFKYHSKLLWLEYSNTVLLSAIESWLHSNTKITSEFNDKCATLGIYLLFNRSGFNKAKYPLTAELLSEVKDSLEVFGNEMKFYDDESNRYVEKFLEVKDLVDKKATVRQSKEEQKNRILETIKDLRVSWNFVASKAGLAYSSLHVFFTKNVNKISQERIDNLEAVVKAMAENEQSKEN